MFERAIDWLDDMDDILAYRDLPLLNTGITGKVGIIATPFYYVSFLRNLARGLKNLVRGQWIFFCLFRYLPQCKYRTWRHYLIAIVLSSHFINLLINLTLFAYLFIHL